MASTNRPLIPKRLPFLAIVGLVVCTVILWVVLVAGIRLRPTRRSFQESEYEIRTSTGSHLVSVFEGTESPGVSRKYFRRMTARARELVNQPSPCFRHEQSLWESLTSWIRVGSAHAQNCQDSPGCTGCGAFWYEDAAVCNNSCLGGNTWLWGGPWNMGEIPYLYNCTNGGQCCDWNMCSNCS